MPEFSVIVPVYKVEKKLKKCLDSIIDQSFTDLEIILVDDGSPDTCGEICDEYAKVDERITVIHKKNAGQGAARNNALDIATGKWVSFVDSDDWIEKNTYELVHNITRKYEPDILIFDTYLEKGKKSKKIHAFQQAFITADKKRINEMMIAALCASMKDFPVGRTLGAPWDKIYNRDFLIRNRIYYEKKVEPNEDVVFNLHSFYNAKKVCYIRDCLYHYTIGENTVTTKYVENRPKISKCILKEMLKIGKKYHLCTDYYQAVFARFIENVRLDGARFYFNKNSNESFIGKLKCAYSDFKQKPYKIAFHNININNLPLRNKILVLAPNKTIMLFILTNARSLYHRYLR